MHRLLIFAAVVTAACTEPQHDELEVARDRWDAKRQIFQHSEFDWKSACAACNPRALHVTVNEREIETVTFIDDGTPADDAARTPVKGIDELFLWLEAQIDRGEQLDVRYDPQLGYPAQISFRASDETTVEYLLEVSNVELSLPYD